MTNPFGISREEYERDMADPNITSGYKTWLRAACGDPYGVRRPDDRNFLFLIFVIVLPTVLAICAVLP